MVELKPGMKVHVNWGMPGGFMRGDMFTLTRKDQAGCWWGIHQVSGLEWSITERGCEAFLLMPVAEE